MAKTERPASVHGTPDDRNAELEAYSRDAVRAALPKEKFVVRDEASPDRGVDITIETKDAVGPVRYATGAKANVQLKSCEKPRKEGDHGASKCSQLGDGTLSYPVPCKTVQTLLNHHCPLFILYVHSSKHLYYSWAWEEVGRIEDSGTDWKTQDSVNIHFKNRLNASSLKALGTEIRRQATVHREVNAQTSKALAEGKQDLTLHIDLRGLSVTDPNQVRQTLFESGMYYVQKGYGTQIIQMMDKLSDEDRQTAQMLLTRGYAEYTKSHYQKASGYLSDTLQKAEELHEDDMEFLMMLRDACDFHTGRITLAEFNERQRQGVETRQGAFGLFSRVEYLKNAYVLERDREKQEGIRQQLKTAVEAVLDDNEASDEMRIMSRIAYLYVDGASVAKVFTQTISDTVVQLSLGMTPNINRMRERVEGRANEWLERSNQLMQDAVNLDVARTGGEAIEGFGFILLMIHATSNLHMIGRDMPRVTILDNEIIKQQVMPNLRTAISLYEKCNNLEGLLKAKLVLADFAEIVGDQEQAVALAKEVIKPATNFQFKRLAEQAQGHIDGIPVYKQREEKRRAIEQIDFDLRTYRDDNKTSKAIARASLQSLDLPSKCLPYLEREIRCSTDMSRERVLHCRYIEIQRLRRVGETIEQQYSKDPDRTCICTLRRYRSRLPHKDWKQVIRAFKGSYCSGCPDRDPKLKRHR